MIKKSVLISLFLIAASLDGADATSLKELSNIQIQEQGKTVEQVIKRPSYHYQANKLRDPFKSYLRKQEPDRPITEIPDPDLPAISEELPTFEIQGIITGGITPQAIIDNKVLAVGDNIKGARIVAITKEGVMFTYRNYEYPVYSPAYNYLKAIKTQSATKGGPNVKK